MKNQDILQKCEYTILKPEATWKDVKKKCDTAVKNQCAAVCIPPCYVRKACNYVGEKIDICTVIGFPLGNTSTATKMAEVRNALHDGARHLDMVINIGWLKSEKPHLVENELNLVKKVCDKFKENFGYNFTFKVIIETCLLTEKEKITMCEIANRCHVDYVKTSTGFSTRGARKEDIELLRRHLSDDIKIKASGGICSKEQAEELIRAGADRLGVSRISYLLGSDK